MKIAAAAFLALLASLSAAFSQARENPYDVLGKTLVPIVNVLSLKASLRALTLDARLIQASKLPPEFQGQTLHLALNAPDRLLLRAPIAGEMMTVCRDRDDLWATPGSKIQYLMSQAAAGSPSPDAAATPESGKPKKKKKKKEGEIAKGAAAAMGPLELPIPEKELVFLPVLFEVADAGDEQIGTTPCRVLDVRLMPQLAQSLHAADWTARLWVDAGDKLEQITVTGPKWSATAAIDKMEFSADLPDTAFQTQDPDVLHLTKSQFVELMSRIGAK